MATKDYYKGITIQYKGDATGLSAALSQINSEMRQSQGAARALDAALKWDGKNVDLVNDRIKVTEKQIKSTTERVDLLKQALSEAKDPEVIERLTRQADIAESKLKGLREEYAKLSVAASADEGLGKVATQLEGVGSTLNTVGQSMSAMGDKMTMGLTVPIVAAGVATVGAATTIDSALTEVRKTVDGTEQEYQKLHDAAIEYSKDNAVTAEQVLNVQALGAQLGYAKDELEMIGRVGSGMDIATDMNAEQATTEMAQFANITKMAHSESENYASTIIDLGNNMATTESKTSSMAQRIAAAGTQVGMSQADILGVAAALSSVGMEAEAGGTAISTIVSKIDKDIATGSEDIATWAAAAGMSADQFASAWRTSPVDALAAVLSGMESATQGGGNMTVMLEELGVSSIRQTDAMKRLANDSSILTGAVDRANKAWQDNTALSEEVANKNDSLSAKFQMLQNRVTAILEKIGKPLADALLTILDAAQPLFDAVEGVANGFASLDKGTQKAIVQFVALAAAAGPVQSVLGRVVDGAGNLAGAFSTGIKGIELFSGAMSAGATASEAMTLVTGELGTALAGPLGIALAAATVAVGAIVSAYMDWQEHTKLVHDATEGLAEAANAAGDAYDSYAEGVSVASQSADEIRESNEEALRSVADFAERIKDSMTDLGTNAAMVDAYSKTMKELGNQGSLSADDLAKLKNAVSEYNSITGAAISITNEQTGALSLMPSQIDEITAAYKRKAEQEAYAELYKDAIKEQAKNQKELEETTKQLGEAQAELTRRYKNHESFTDGLTHKVTALEQKQKDLSASSESLAEDVDHWGDKISDASTKFSSIETAMTAAGVTGEQYAQLTDAQLAEISASFDGTIQSIAAILARFGISVGDTGSQIVREAQAAAQAAAAEARQAAQAAAEEQRKVNDQIISEQQSANDQFIKEQQKANEQALEEQRKANEQAIKEQQKANEQVIKEKQKANERENKEREKANESANKELRKQQEAEEDALSKHLAAEEEAIRKSNEARLAQQRKANEQQEDALSKSLDARIDVIKKSLDAEIAAKRKANAKTLKDAKDADAAETKAYKAETSARIKEMDRELKAKLKMLEESDGTKEIDERIKRLQGENDAEDRALKERERTEKVAELQSAVDKAKSRRKRADAEKELNEYLAQIEHERREQERKDEIDRLNDQKSNIKEETQNKKDALTEQYEHQKEQYETQRAEQLEREDKQRDEDYERLSEFLSNQLDQRREAADAIIEQEREKASEQVATMREQHSEQESALKEMLDKELEARREAHYERLDQLKEQHSEVMERQREQQAEILEKRREEQQAELDSIRENHQAELDLMREDQKTKLDQMRENQQAELDQTRANLADQLKALKDNLDAQVKAIAEKGPSVSDAMGNVGSDAKDKFADGIKTMPADTGNTAKQTLKQYLDNINDMPWSTKRLADTTGHNLQERLNAYVMPTTDASKALRNAALREIQGLPGEGKSSGEGMGSGLAGGIGSKSGEVSNSATGLKNAAENPFSALAQAAGGFGSKASTDFASGISVGGETARSNAESVGGDVSRALSSPSNSSGRWGNDFIVNFNNGVVSAWNNVSKNFENIAQFIADLFRHSTPSKGPLKGDDVWLYHMMQNFDEGAKRGTPQLMSTIEGIAQGVADGMDVDVVGNLVDHMRLGEDELATQTERMARVMERSFSPELSARYDANVNYARRGAITSTAAAFGTVAGPNITMNLNLDNVHIASDMDMRQTAKDLAAEVMREVEASMAIA